MQNHYIIKKTDFTRILQYFMTIQQLLSPARAAVEKYAMIQEGDRVAVGLSGGKDSVTLLTILAALRNFYPKKFDVVAITVDMGFKDADEGEKKAVAEYCASLGVQYEVVPSEIGPILFDYRKESNPCSLCAKMRRGALNSAAKSLGCNKLALGHHADDMMQTFLLSLFFEGRLSTFAPVSYMSKSDITLIRPMIFLREKDVAAFAKDKPVLHNPCPANKHTRREDMKDYLAFIRKEIPFAEERVFTALVHPERYNLFDKFEKNCLFLKERAEERLSRNFGQNADENSAGQSGAEQTAAGQSAEDHSAADLPTGISAAGRGTGETATSSEKIR